MVLKIGDPAPDFALSVSLDKQIKLSDLAGKFALLYFYPKDNTPGCSR